ncbi:hypothetical protein J2S78_000649 [Salibacterium salarium]|nr:hypothetical protein [Salibacterium salarium]
MANLLKTSLERNEYVWHENLVFGFLGRRFILQAVGTGVRPFFTMTTIALCI